MRRILMGALLAYLLPVFIAITVLLTVPQLRHVTFRYISEAPTQVFYFMIRRHVISRNFSTAEKWLTRQLELSDSFGVRNNILLPGLVQNATYVIDRIQFQEEWRAIKPFALKLAKSQPDLLPARIWSARALSDDNASLALKHAEAAIRLASTDDRAYRIALNIAIRKGLSNEVKKWCARYKIAQFGGRRSYEYNTLFLGSDIRRFAMEVRAVTGERQIIGHKGIHLNEARDYAFELEKPLSIDRLILHFGLIPGVKIALKKMTIFRSSSQRAIDMNQVVLTSQTGFHLENGDVLTTSIDGETVEMHGQNKPFGNADRIVLNMNFSRAKLTSPDVCQKVD